MAILALIGGSIILFILGLGLILTSGKNCDLKKAGFGALLVFISLMLWWFAANSEFWLVDKCLDSGGRFNYELEVCEYE